MLLPSGHPARCSHVKRRARRTRAARSSSYLMLSVPIGTLILTLGRLPVMTVLFELARCLAALLGSLGDGRDLVALIWHEFLPELVERGLVALFVDRADRLGAHGAGIREIVTGFLDCLEVAAQFAIFKNLIV